jgi:hypothetical protein
MTQKRNTLNLPMSLSLIGGPFLAICSAIAQYLAKDSAWPLGLLGGSLVFLWVACIAHFQSVQEHHKLMEAAIHVLSERIVGNLEDIDDLKNRILSLGIQSLTFDGCEINDEFWIKYAPILMNYYDQKDPLDKLRIVLEIKRDKKIEAKGSHIYELINLFSHLVDDYMATAAEDELKVEFAKQTIFKVPLEVAVRIRRLFLITDEAVLRQLSEDRKKDLISQTKKNNVELRYHVIRPNEHVPNLGIYGNLAVDQFVTRTSRITPNTTSVFKFDKSEIDRKRQEFMRYWDRATPIDEQFIRGNQ